MAFPSTLELNYGDEKLITTQKSRALGTVARTPDGRIFKWARNGATALAQAVVVQMKPAANGQQLLNLTPATSIGDWNATAGAPGIQVGSATIGVFWTSVHSSAEFTDGYMMVETSPGMGTYRVVQDGTVTSTGGASTVRLHPDDTIAQEILTTVTKLAFIANPYSSVIVTPTVMTGAVLGVNPVEVPINNYFWLQTTGVARVRYNALVAALVGHQVIAGVGATAGDAVGGPNTTLVTTAALTTLSQLAYGSRPILGYALEGIPDDGDFMKIMMTLQA